MEEPYFRTYSRSFSQALDDGIHTKPSTSSDHAIACALAAMAEEAPPARPDTSLDEQLAMQLYERETGKLLRAPSRKARRRDRTLQRLLKHLKPTKVIPRLNPLTVPTGSYVSEDRQRLLLRLDMYALQERTVQGDGNCQFRALADQLYHREGRHAEVRQAVVDQLCCCPERYRDYVTTDYKEYVSSMSKLGTWGDHVTLQAAADAFNLGINIVTSFLDNCVISITPIVADGQQPSPEETRQQTELLKQEQQQQQPQGPQELAMQQLQTSPQPELAPLGATTSDDRITLWLSFWAEVHYNSLAPKSVSADSSSESDSSFSISDDESSGGGSGKFLGSSGLKRLVQRVF